MGFFFTCSIAGVGFDLRIFGVCVFAYKDWGILRSNQETGDKGVLHTYCGASASYMALTITGQ